MDKENGYFLYVLSKIIPEVAHGLIKICPYDDLGVIFRNIDRFSKAERGFTLSYTRGVKSKKKIALPDNIL